MNEAASIPGAFAKVEALLSPRNVVLVGASDRPGHWSARVHSNLARYGFAGNVYLVNPKRDQLFGERAYSSVADLPEAPDHLAIFVPAGVTIDVLAEAAACGARSATLFAAGFGEGGSAEGRARGERLRAVLHETGIAAAGPNCMGIASGHSRLVTIADENLEILGPGQIAVIAQSGLLCASFARALTDRDLSVAYLISCGNQIGLTIADYVSYFAADPLLKVVIVYVEALPDAAAFFAAARAARAAGKTIVAIKAGVSEEAKSAALAHTGSLTGSSEAFDVFAAEAGIVRVGSLEDAVEAAEFLSRAPRPRGPRGAYVTHSGALKTLMSDAAVASGLEFAALVPATRARLAQAMGPDADIANPLDTKKTQPAETLAAIVKTLREADEVDFVVLTEELPRVAGVARKIANFEVLEASMADDTGAPLAVLAPIKVRDNDYTIGFRHELSHLPILNDLGKSFRTLAAMAKTAAPRVRPPALAAIDIADLLPPGGDGPVALTETASKAILSRYGVRIAKESVAASADEAVAAAEAIGYPVVLKAVAAAITHKSDAGLVRLGLSRAADVRAVHDELVATCAGLGVETEGVLVAEQVTGGVEMVLGLQRDPEFGPVLMVGMGGIWLELFADVAFASVDLDRDGALAAIARTKAHRLLSGYRGSAPVDVIALADAMVALARLGRDHGDIIEAVDINPILVRSDGAVALDGLVILTTTTTD